jgi:hypothetical protein
MNDSEERKRMAIHIRRRFMIGERKEIFYSFSTSA